MINCTRKPKIALIGPYPPPYGGISVHIKRLKEQLEKKGYECLVYDLGRHKPTEGNIIRVKHSKRWLLRNFFFATEDIVHYHNSYWRWRVIMGMMGLLGKKTVITIHGESLRDSLKGSNLFKKHILKFALKHTAAIIVINPETYKYVLSLGVIQERIKNITSFLPPTIRKDEVSEIPQEVWNFIDSHRPVISANAFRLKFYNGQDLYGLDMCVELCARLKNDYPDIGFVFALSDIGDNEYFQKMKQRIVEKRLKNNFFFQTKPCQFYPILLKSDVFVRPTNTDGFGISIGEAIHFKIPAVASNVCTRPEGTILFQNREIDDFTTKVKDVLDNYDDHKRRLVNVKLEDCTDKIIELYERLTAITIDE